MFLIHWALSRPCLGLLRLSDLHRHHPKLLRSRDRIEVDRALLHVAHGVAPDFVLMARWDGGAWGGRNNVLHTPGARCRHPHTGTCNLANHSWSARCYGAA